MNQMPAAHLAVAPHFHLPLNWAERVRIATAVPRGPWREASEDELSSLLAPPTLSREQGSECVFLFSIPEHLRGAFWDLLDRAEQAGGTDLLGFDAFATEVHRFLAFKQLELPREVSFELLVRQQAQGAEIAHAETAFPDGLCGAINLGDAPTSLILGNEASQVRVRIDPGEGVRMPRIGPPVQFAPPETDEPELLLLIRDKGMKS